MALTWDLGQHHPRFFLFQLEDDVGFAVLIPYEWKITNNLDENYLKPCSRREKSHSVHEEGRVLRQHDKATLLSHGKAKTIFN